MDEKTYNMMFGARVRYYRERLGMTQKELSEKIGYTSAATITRIEKGAQTIPLNKLPDFCVALDCRPFDLLGLSENDKKVWFIAENMQNSAKNSDISHFIDLYMKLLKDGK